MRWNQGIRIVQSIGILRALFLFLIATGIIFLFYKNLSNRFSSYIIILLGLSIIYIQLIRKDKSFLKSIYTLSSFIFLIDYFFLSIPFLIRILIQQQWSLLILVGIILVIPFLQIDFIRFRKSSTYKKPFFILSDSIEWIAGVRKNQFLFFIFYLGGFSLSFLPYGFLASIIFFTALISSFFEHGEPLEMLIAKEYHAKKFIRWKIGNHIKQYLLLTFPWFIIALIIQIDWIWIYIGFYIYTILINTCIVLIKYASYQPSGHAFSSFQTGFLLACLFIPFLIPIPLFFSIRDYRKSVQRLDYFLHDYC